MHCLTYILETNLTALENSRLCMSRLSSLKPNIRMLIISLDNNAADGSEAFEDL